MTRMNFENYFPDAFSKIVSITIYTKYNKPFYEQILFQVVLITSSNVNFYFALV